MADNGYNRQQTQYIYELLHGSLSDLSGLNAKYGL
jgi:hypothetical protein